MATKSASKIPKVISKIVSPSACSPKTKVRKNILLVPPSKGTTTSESNSGLKNKTALSKSPVKGANNLASEHVSPRIKNELKVPKIEKHRPPSIPISPWNAEHQNITKSSKTGKSSVVVKNKPSTSTYVVTPRPKKPAAASAASNMPKPQVIKRSVAGQSSGGVKNKSSIPTSDVTRLFKKPAVTSAASKLPTASKNAKQFKSVKPAMRIGTIGPHTSMMPTLLPPSVSKSNARTSLDLVKTSKTSKTSQSIMQVKPLSSLSVAHVGSVVSPSGAIVSPTPQTQKCSIFNEDIEQLSKQLKLIGQMPLKGLSLQPSETLSSTLTSASTLDENKKVSGEKSEDMSEENLIVSSFDEMKTPNKTIDAKPPETSPAIMIGDTFLGKLMNTPTMRTGAYSSNSGSSAIRRSLGTSPSVVGHRTLSDKPWSPFGPAPPRIFNRSYDNFIDAICDPYITEDLPTSPRFSF